MAEEHEKECKCAICEKGVVAAMQEQQKLMDKYGWIVHFVTDHDSGSPTGCNYHTHGLDITFKHPDLQIVLPLPPKVAHNLFSSAVDLIKAGTRFTAGVEYDKVIKGLKVTFIQEIENDRAILRMILPSSNGSLDPRTMNGEQAYRDQFQSVTAMGFTKGIKKV